MINNTSLNKWHRLHQKDLDTKFLNNLMAGLHCPPMVADGILDVVHQTYQPYFTHNGEVGPGQARFEVVCISNPPGTSISTCRMRTVILTIDGGGEDLEIREKFGVTGLRRHRVERISYEAFQQDGLLTVEDIANRVLNCGERTVVRDIAELKEQGIILPLRSTVKDIGRAITHRDLIVKDWLEGMEFSDICARRNHSVGAVANYVDKFKRVVCLTADGHDVSTIAFLVKASIPLCMKYQELYRSAEIVEHRVEQLEHLLKKSLERN